MEIKKEASASSIIKTSIVTAFTLTAAFIWKDVISLAIQRFIPSNNQLLFMFFAAIITTIFVIVAIFIFLKTEDEAEFVVRRFRTKK